MSSLRHLPHAQRLKESHHEVNANMRARMREMTMHRTLAGVLVADLEVINPTRCAVALRYDDKKIGAPRFVAKGADLLAMAIRDQANASKVPVLRAPVQARTLYAHAERLTQPVRYAAALRRGRGTSVARASRNRSRVLPVFARLSSSRAASVSMCSRINCSARVISPAASAATIAA